jgi:hypothetical protein
MSNLITMKPAIKTPARPSVPSAYDGATVGEIASCWTFEQLDSDRDLALIDGVVELLNSLLRGPRLTRWGCTKVHMMQACLRLLVDNTRDMERASEAGGELAQAYFTQALSVGRLM